MAGSMVKAPTPMPMDQSMSVSSRLAITTAKAPLHSAKGSGRAISTLVSIRTARGMATASIPGRMEANTLGNGRTATRGKGSSFLS